MASRSLSTTDTPSVWHSIRPWRPTLSLSVREITSVSATFVLSSPLATVDTSTDPVLASLDLDADEDSEPHDGAAGGSKSGHDTDGGMVTRSTQIISDVLSKGLSVKVNGTPWQRVLMKIDDISDEAIIILFGLMPGRQYDIELGIVPGENAIRGQITTVDTTRPRSDTDSSQERSFSSSDSLSHQPSPPSTSSSLHSSSSLNPLQSSSSLTITAHNSTPSSPPSLSLDDRRLQLTHKLNLLTSQHATLTADLKTVRRESQKADAALRSEIDLLKRASEKNAQNETRAKQKVLALQEAVRRTVSATGEIKKMVEEIESELPGLESRRVEVEGEWKETKKEAESVKAKRVEVEGTERKRVESLQSEVANLGNRMERLNARREKLEGEGGVISDLEERLKKLEEEREKVENDPFGYGYDLDDRRHEDRRGSTSSRPEGSTSSQSQHPPRNRQGQNQQHHHSHSMNQSRNNHHPRKRHSHPAHQRQQSQRQGGGHAPRPSLPAGPGVIHLNVNPNSTKLNNNDHHHGHGRHKNPSGSSGSSLSTPPNPSQIQVTTGATGGSTQVTATQVTASTLSSRAPAFEPSMRRQARSGSVNSIGTGASTGSIGVKFDLNPGSSPFSPRSGVAISAVQAAIAAGSSVAPSGSGVVSGSKKSGGGK